MRKLISLFGIVLIAAIAIAWSTSDRTAVASRTEIPTTTSAAMSPHEIMLNQSNGLPVDYWADPF